MCFHEDRLNDVQVAYITICKAGLDVNVRIEDGAEVSNILVIVKRYQTTESWVSDDVGIDVPDLNPSVVM